MHAELDRAEVPVRDADVCSDRKVFEGTSPRESTGEHRQSCSLMPASSMGDVFEVVIPPDDVRAVACRTPELGG